MVKEVLTFGDIELKIFFYHNKIPDNYKYFIDYLYNDLQVKLLHIMLPKTGAYVKSYDGQT